jgi:single-strand DNA-binding protein
MSINGKIEISFTGNLTADPEIRFTPSGVAVCSFGVAVTPRIMDTESGQWKDGPTSFLRTNVWREQAEHVAESLKKGQRVSVTGLLYQRDWEDPETKAKRTSWEVKAEEVAASLRYATAKVTKATKSAPADAAAPQTDQPPF